MYPFDGTLKNGDLFNVGELDHRNLYVKGLWKECTQVELDDLFKQYGTISQSRVYGNGVAFVRFQDPRQALAAIIGLNGTRPHPRCPQPFSVKFANKKIKQPRPLTSTSEPMEIVVCENTKNVYLRFLPLKYTESDLYQLCSKFGRITCIRMCKKGIGFVRFLSGEFARQCVQELHGKLLPESNKPLMVKYANSDPFEPRIGFRSSHLEKYQEQRPQVNQDFLNVHNSNCISNARTTENINYSAFAPTNLNSIKVCSLSLNNAVNLSNHFQSSAPSTISVPFLTSPASNAPILSLNSAGNNCNNVIGNANIFVNPVFENQMTYFKPCDITPCFSKIPAVVYNKFNMINTFDHPFQCANDINRIPFNNINSFSTFVNFKITQ